MGYENKRKNIMPEKEKIELAVRFVYNSTLKMILPIVGDLTVGVYKNRIWRLQFFFFGHNIASDCSPIPWVFKTVLNFKIKLVAATQGGKKSNYPHLQTVIF